MPQNNPFAAPEWDSVDVSILRSFFLTPTGKKLLHRLRNDRPSIDLESTEGAALSAARANGYETAVGNLFEYLITDVAPEELSTQYPSLDRDDVWGPDLQPDAFRIALTPAVRTSPTAQKPAQ